MSERASGLTPSNSITGLTAAWAIGSFALALALLFVLQSVSGPNDSANAKSLIEQEDFAVCTNLGFQPGDAKFRDCATALDEVRAKANRSAEQSIL